MNETRVEREKIRVARRNLKQTEENQLGGGGGVVVVL